MNNSDLSQQNPVHIGSLKILLWLKCILKLLYCSLRMKIKWGGRGNKRGVRGKEEGWLSKLLTALFTGFNEGWRAYLFKEPTGAVWEQYGNGSCPRPTTNTSLHIFLIGDSGTLWSLCGNTVAVSQINGFYNSGEVFKITDNGRDYKYKSLEGARFLRRTIRSFLSGIILKW